MNWSSIKPQFHIPNYEILDEVTGGDRYALFRGLRTEDQSPVLLKTTRSDSRSAVDSLLIEQEFNTLSTLLIEGIPRAYELLRHEHRVFLVTEDRGGIPLRSLIASYTADIDAFFNIAIQLSSILSKLHREGIIHGNINVETVLVNPATGEVQLSDLGFASRSTQRHHPLPHRLSSNALPYVSPEQTGRISRTIDHRTDLYSLGAIFYELLTGTTPFSSSDPLEIIHGHIARTPQAPAEIQTRIPSQVSDIVMKLLSKNADHRYQSALGLKEDLEVCAAQWKSQRRIGSFRLGVRDIPHHFVVSQELYGRDAEVGQLLSAFERVCEGNVVMMLVSGYAGIGKTSLIQELYKPIVRERGYFIAGKFDQIATSTPFGALIQAFRAFVQQLLTESEARLDEWRSRLSAALEANGGVIAEVIPEIELILGKQSRAPGLAPAEVQNRFRHVFQNFVAAIAHREHPLVIFLDDLQWVDTATLSLFEPLLTSPDIRYLFLIGAYRDNEVEPAHPLMRAVTNLAAEGVALDQLSLGPLELAQLTLLIRDTLHCNLDEAESLGQLVLQKTGGNPFFVTQFLTTLRQEGLIEFDYEKVRWVFQPDAVASARITDNVVDLMTRKIQRLSPETQNTLMLGACVGNPFDLRTLAIVSQQTPEEAAGDLQGALAEGLLMPVADPGVLSPDSSRSDLQPATMDLKSYAFLHDRVQQAAYALIPEDKQQLVHLRVGRLLLESANLEQTEEKLFDIVHHLNIGCSLIDDEDERLALAGLDLRAARKAKRSAAFDAALHYLRSGLSALNESSWESDYELVFSLNNEAAECEYLCGNFDAAEEVFELLLAHARSNLDKARVYRLKSVQRETMSRYEDALEIARESLALFGVSFPHSPDEKQSALETEIQAIQSSLGERTIESLIDLPEMTDAERRMVMRILTDLWSSSYILGDAILARLISATMVRLSLTHGNLAESAYGYVTHAITVGPVRGDYESAYEFGKLALRVNDRFNDSTLRAKIYQQFHAHVSPWVRPMQECIPYAQEACRSGLETGDFLYAAYGASTESWPAFFSTQDLAAFVQHFAPNLSLIKKLKIVTFADSLQMVINWAQALRGETRSPLSLSNDNFDESEYAETYRGNSFFTLFHAVAKLHLFYNFGEYRKALETSRAVRDIAHQLKGMIWTVLFDFWNGLTLAANFDGSTEDEKRAYLDEMEEAQKRLAVLAESCPENFRCQSLLLSAEINRITDRPLAAADLFEKALSYARESGALQHSALASELYSRFWLQRGAEEIGAVFMNEAQSFYSGWGAIAKAQAIERESGTLLEQYSSIGADHEDQSLDVETAVRAAQAIAREIDLEKLLRQLLTIAIENAGAERGSLILEEEGQAVVQASGTAHVIEVNLNNKVPLEQESTLSKSIVNYVRRTLKSVILADARVDDRYASDEYILRRQSRSILCTPVLKQGKLVGVLYLENDLVTGAFTSNRIKLLQLITSGAAISIENARLYQDVKQEVVQRRQAEETLRSIVEGTAAVTGGDFFSALVRHLATVMGVRYAFVTECTDQTKTRLRTLAFWAGEALADNIEYDLALTPCEAVIGGQICHHPVQLQTLFPGDKDLATLGAESFIGLPMCDDSGEIVGHLAVIDNRPMPDVSSAMPLLRIFAARAGAELQRLKAEQELRQALAEVELLKNRLHAENIYLQEEIRREHNFEEIVGNSPALLEVLADVERVAPTDSTVLIYGETGTGKELIARAVHDRSSRKRHPLVKVNCGAISAGLVESELFGHVKGAFTGAIDRRVGRFELANGGTLFLDEVSELPVETQVKLLRVLQEGEFEPVGSSRTVRVDVRIIAATNRNLEEAVQQGRFRSDLFYRLNVFPLRVPPLRERKSDVVQLVIFFLSRFSKKLGRKIDSVSQDTMDRLLNYSWPGNVRELQNIIERGVVVTKGSVLTLGHELVPVSATATHAAENSPMTVSSRNDRPTLEDVERKHILSVLKESGWVIEGAKGAARVLNLHPNTLRSRMKKLGITRSAHEIS